MTITHSLLIAIILGIVEGLTEFFPVSSTGHMIIISHILNFENDISKTLEVVIQLGSALAIIIKFWNRFFNLINIHFSCLPQSDSCDTQSNSFDKKKHLTLAHILLAMVPVVILGLFFHDFIKSLFTVNVIYALVIGGVLLIVVEIIKPKIPLIKSLDEITYYQAFFIGCFQCLALWPGFSRLGVTISGGILIGLSRYVASEFSFFLAVPMTLGATVLDLFKSTNFLTIRDIPVFIVGFITAYIVAQIAIKTFLRLIEHVSFIPFAIYRFIVATAVYMIFT